MPFDGVNSTPEPERLQIDEIAPLQSIFSARESVGDLVSV
jgi:hypothetical protein